MTSNWNGPGVGVLVPFLVVGLFTGFGSVLAFADQGEPSAAVETLEFVEEFEWVPADAPAEAAPLMRLVGRFHILLVHYPIAWMWLAAGLSLVRLRWPDRIGGWDLILIGLSVLALLPVLFTGWIHHLHITGDSQTLTLLQRHKILAFITLGAAVVAFVTRYRAGNGPMNKRHQLAFFILVLSTTLISITAHLGGSMVYGTDFLVFW